MPAEINPYQPPVNVEPPRRHGPRGPRFVAATLLILLLPATVAAGTIVFLMAFAACGMVIGPHESEYVAAGQFLLASVAALVTVVLVFRGFLRVLTILLGPTESPATPSHSNSHDASKSS